MKIAALSFSSNTPNTALIVYDAERVSDGDQDVFQRTNAIITNPDASERELERAALMATELPPDMRIWCHDAIRSHPNSTYLTMEFIRDSLAGSWPVPIEQEPETKRHHIPQRHTHRFPTTFWQALLGIRHTPERPEDN